MRLTKFGRSERNIPLVFLIVLWVFKNFYSFNYAKNCSSVKSFVLVKSTTDDPPPPPPHAFFSLRQKPDFEGLKLACKVYNFMIGPILSTIVKSGGRFSKDPVTYRARKAILETMIRLPSKATLLICFRYKERQNNCQVSKLETCSYWRYKGIYLTRKVSGRSRNGPLGYLNLLSRISNPQVTYRFYTV